MRTPDHASGARTKTTRTGATAKAQAHRVIAAALGLALSACGGGLRIYRQAKPNPFTPTTAFLVEDPVFPSEPSTSPYAHQEREDQPLEIPGVDRGAYSTHMDWRQVHERLLILDARGEIVDEAHFTMPASGETKRHNYGYAYGFHSAGSNSGFAVAKYLRERSGAD